MSNRYAKQTLRRLRNDIPIAILIADILELPCKTAEGYFRFLCPRCGGFDTATNPKTNLARCFTCKQNLNPIDINDDQRGIQGQMTRGQEKMTMAREKMNEKLAERKHKMVIAKLHSLVDQMLVSHHC